MHHRQRHQLGLAQLRQTRPTAATARIRRNRPPAPSGVLPLAHARLRVTRRSTRYCLRPWPAHRPVGNAVGAAPLAARPSERAATAAAALLDLAVTSAEQPAGLAATVRHQHRGPVTAGRCSRPWSPGRRAAGPERPLHLAAVDHGHARRISVAGRQGEDWPSGPQHQVGPGNLPDPRLVSGGEEANGLLLVELRFQRVNALLEGFLAFLLLLFADRLARRLVGFFSGSLLCF
jgi:hypothetical protein